MAFRNQSVFAIRVLAGIRIMVAVFKRSPIVLLRYAEKTRTATQVLTPSNVSVHLASRAIHTFNVSVSSN